MMSTELLQLPVFKTERGRLIDAQGELPDLRYGFVLSEAVTQQQIPRIHNDHTLIARVVLSCAELASPQADIVEEFAHTGTLNYSPPHMDGLVGYYWQVNTVHPSCAGQDSRMVLSRFDLDDEEHEAMQVLRASGFGKSHGHGVDFYPPQQGVIFGSISPVLGNREPDAGWVADAGPNSTIVFPNGYDATDGSKPGALFVHHFSTIEIDGHEGPRTVSLSRIEPRTVAAAC
jgi:hypothetical protein